MLDISIGILAGGKSSRFGENKAFATYKEKTFIETIVSTCSLFSEILVSVDNKQKYKNIPYRLVEDEIKDYGPLEGIHQILKYASNKYSFIVATDMPLIKKEIIETLRDNVADDIDCVVLRCNNNPEPLCSIYSKKCISIIDKMIEENLKRPRMLYERCNVKYIDIENIGFNKIDIINVNTKEELKNLPL